jgi:hypothetical protein
VIKGWEKGIASMKRGEEAVLVCPPKLAYGKRGRAPLIPPSATLAFCIRLVNWHQGEDLLGDMGIVKTLMEAGIGKKCPREADICEGTTAHNTYNEASWCVSSHRMRVCAHFKASLSDFIYQ